MAHVELMRITAEEIINLKKQTDHLIFENAQLVLSRGKVEAFIDESCQHIYESMAELDAVSKAKRLGKFII